MKWSANVKKILLLQKMDESGMKMLEDAGFQVDIPEDTSEAGLCAVAGDYDAIIVRGMVPVPESVIAKAVNCKIIGRHGVGLETIDVQAATREHIPVAYTPGANANAVAEQAVGLMLDILKKTCLLSRKLMLEKNYQCRLGVINSELQGKTVGVFGLGNIGRKVANICTKGFGATIIGFDPYVSEERFQSMGLDGRLTTDMDDLLANSDIVTLHAPGSEKGMIGTHALATMKQGSILINTARGTLVDEAALYDALVSGHLAGAGLDVTASEPPDPNNPLFTLDNVVATPHTAALTKEGNQNMAVGVAEQVRDLLLEGKRPWGFANPEVWETRRT